MSRRAPARRGARGCSPGRRCGRPRGGAGDAPRRGRAPHRRSAGRTRAGGVRSGRGDRDQGGRAGDAAGGGTQRRANREVEGAGGGRAPGPGGHRARPRRRGARRPNGRRGEDRRLDVAKTETEALRKEGERRAQAQARTSVTEAPAARRGRAAGTARRPGGRLGKETDAQVASELAAHARGRRTAVEGGPARARGGARPNPRGDGG